MSFAKSFFRTIYQNDKIFNHIVHYKRYDLIKNFDTNTLNKLNVKGDTMLHEAVKQQNYTLAETLLKNDASKYIKNFYGDNVYDIAVAKRDYKMLQLLAKHNTENNNCSNCKK
jgi:ankyrin repeat protein